MKKLIVVMMVASVLGVMIAAGCNRQMTSIIKNIEIKHPRLTPQEAVEIYAKSFDEWYPASTAYAASVAMANGWRDGNPDYQTEGKI